MSVCLFTDKLLDGNRQVLETLLANPDALDPWVRSWLEDFDLFFMDVRQAVDLGRNVQRAAKRSNSVQALAWGRPGTHE